MNLELILKELKAESEALKKIQTPIEVMEFFSNNFSKKREVACESWGQDDSGREILTYTFGSGEKSVLLYAFADPAEAVGGTGIIALAKLLMNPKSELNQLNLKWVIVPCLNFIDQPNNGLENSKMMKTKSQEVDWCVDNPRSETKAILNIASKYQPIFTFPLHDEYHDPEYVAPYCGLGSPISEKTKNNIVDLFLSFNMEMNPEYKDEILGDGFFIMHTIGEEIKNSTFYQFSKYGQVLVCEIPNTPKVSESNLVYLQMAIGFSVLKEIF